MTASAPTRGFRPEVEGLRAIAVLTVMWFHRGCPAFPGGSPAIADNPQPGGEIYACVAGHPTSYMSDCSRPAGPGSGTRALAAAVEMVDTSRLVNLNDVICPGGTCWPVIGNVLVYRSGSHITATFVNTLTDTLATRLDIALTDLGVRH